MDIYSSLLGYDQAFEWIFIHNLPRIFFVWSRTQQRLCFKVDLERGTIDCASARYCVTCKGVGAHRRVMSWQSSAHASGKALQKGA